MFNVTNTSVNMKTLSSTLLDIAIPYTARFWIFLISNVASLLCSIFVLYHIFTSRPSRRAVHNHVVILILILNFVCLSVDIPWFLYSYQYGVVWIQHPYFCRFWRFIDSTIFVGVARLVAWASIERHILIFHDSWVSTTKKRIFAHYIPLLLILTYTNVYFITVNMIIPCNTQYDYSIPLCAFISCAYSLLFGYIELMTGGVANSLIIAIFSVTLVIRFMKQKKRVNKQLVWRKHRKMTIQLVSITSLFYILYLPLVTRAIIQGFTGQTYAGRVYQLYGAFFSYHINFLLPFICAGTLPELKLKLRRVFQFWKTPMNRVMPERTAWTTTRIRFSIE